MGVRCKRWAQFSRNQPQVTIRSVTLLLAVVFSWLYRSFVSQRHFEGGGDCPVTVAQRLIVSSFFTLCLTDNCKPKIENKNWPWKRYFIFGTKAFFILSSKCVSCCYQRCCCQKNFQDRLKELFSKNDFDLDLIKFISCKNILHNEIIVIDV